ncbi:MAG: hypothetical protein WCH05_06250 [Chlorobiaceae bacterium]
MTILDLPALIDLSGIGSDHIRLAVIGYSAVFAALFLLALLFILLPKILSWNVRRRLHTGVDDPGSSLRGGMIPGEVSAAIAMAISLYFAELHDQESAILTVKKVGKTYSPWNSKIYNVINFKGHQR